ncbi:sugar ABC transporter ATP-binding protein [Tessaracoccus defluvii]
MEQEPVTSAQAAGGDKQPILSVRGISKRFGGVQALDDVSLDLYPGEVHCLAGENGCGKSTLIKVISGAETPDSGEIVIEGASHRHMNTTSAIESGIQVIYQDFSLFPSLTVAENIVLTSAIAVQKKFYTSGAARATAKAIVDELQLDLDLDAEVGELSVANKQLTAICRALVSDARVIFMDEPTTALTHTEVKRLFQIVDQLRDRGVALVFVSHKLTEILQISQQVTIMRSGKVVKTGPVSEFDTRSIARHMTGRDIEDVRIVSDLPESSPLCMEVKDLTLNGAFWDVNFDVRRGEIIGVTGLLGSGRTEIAESLFGLLPPDRGEVLVDGERVELSSINGSVSAGIGYVPEDRLTQGLFLEKSIADNITAGSLDQHRTRWHTLDFRKVKATIHRLFTELRIKAPNAKAAVRTLSGGNAQRVVLAKWLATKPKVLILNGPTVGVDVGSKEQILELLREQASEGMAIIVISDDEPELVACCHRVLVVTKGRITTELRGDDVSVERIQESMAA